MKNNNRILFEGIVKLLSETKDSHLLRENEYTAIAALVDAIAYSNDVIRNIFYTEVLKVVRMVDKEQNKLHKEIGGVLRKYRKVWGDEELGEDICNLLDEEDAKLKDIDEPQPKKKVIN